MVGLCNQTCADEAFHNLGAGQLGDGFLDERRTPTAVSQLTNVLSITVGFIHTCAVLNNGTAYCWGSNEYGEWILPQQQRLHQVCTCRCEGWIALAISCLELHLNHLNFGLSPATHIAMSKRACQQLPHTSQCNFHTTGQLGDGLSSNKHVPTLVFGLTFPS